MITLFKEKTNDTSKRLSSHMRSVIYPLHLSVLTARHGRFFSYIYLPPPISSDSPPSVPHAALNLLTALCFPHPARSLPLFSFTFLPLFAWLAVLPSILFFFPSSFLNYIIALRRALSDPHQFNRSHPSLCSIPACVRISQTELVGSRLLFQIFSSS